MPPKSKKQHPKPKSQPPDHPKPNWPPLRPLIPSSNLSLESLLHDQIYLIRNFLPSSLCKTYAFFLASLPLTTTPSKPKKGEAVRVNDRFQIQDADFAERLWSGTALRELVSGAVDEDQDGDGQPRSNREIWGGEPLGLNANIRVYRYSRGQFFAQHCMSPPPPLPSLCPSSFLGMRWAE